MATQSPNPYLRKRIEQYQASIYKNADEAFDAMLLEYAKAQREVLDELARLWAKHSTEDGLTLSEMHKYSRFQKLDEKLTSLGKSLGAAEEKLLRETLGEVWTAAQHELSSVLSYELVNLPKSRIDEVMKYPWSGANFSSRIWENKQLLVRQLRETLVRGMVQGQSFSQMTKAVQSVMGGHAYQARRLVRTEAMFFMNQAQLDQYAKLNVEKVQYLAVTDRRTCGVCAPDDGREFKLGSEIVLPRHPNCRCTYIPVVEGTENWFRPFEFD